MADPKDVQQAVAWLGTPEQIDGPIDPSLFIDKASLLMPLGLRLSGADGGEPRIEVESLDDDPEIARDLNTLMRYAANSGQALWGRTSTEKVDKDHSYQIPAGANLAAGSLLDGVARMASLTHAILAIARQSLRDPGDKSYDPENLIHTALDNPETPFFVNAQDVMKGTGTVFDPYNQNSGLYRASGDR